MRNAPFNAKDIAALEEPLKEHGWLQRNRTGDSFRFTLLPKERVACLTVVSSIEAPFKGRLSFPLVSVKFSVLASLGMVKDEFLRKLASYWSQKLKDVQGIVAQVLDTDAVRGLSDDPGIKARVKAGFVDQLPELSPDKDEHAIIQLVRMNLASRKWALGYVACKTVADTFKELNIQPTRAFDEIFELKDGLSPALMDKLLVFKNPTQLEMVFLEPGFFTYYRDMEVENVQLRVHVESHALEPLVGEWKVDLPAFLASIIKGIRLAFSACVNLTGITDFKKVYFVKRNFDLLVKDHVKNADPRNPRDELVFPLPNQWHEILHAHAQALAFPSWNLFTKPPETFDELEGRGTYLESRRQAKLGNVADIISKLAATLPVFNKAGQKYAFFLVLVELGRLAVKVGNTVECKAKFDLALDFAMKNDAMVNPDEIITIQEEYAQASIKLGDTDNAIRQYTLLFNYLERSRPDSDSKRIAVLVQLNKIFISRPDSGSLDHEIQSNFKKIKEFGDKHKDRFVTSSYYHVLGLYHEQQKKPSQAIPAYQRAIAEAEVMGLIDPVIASTVRLASMFLYGKKKNLAQAEKLLLRANEIVGKTDDLGSELQVYEMLHDLYNQKDDMELAAHFNKESTRLRVALKARGN